MTVAIVVKGYPRLSETFIAQEILGLERRGVGLRIVSLRHPTDRQRHAVHGEIAAPVTYLPEYLHHEPRRTATAWRRARTLPGYAHAWNGFRSDVRRDPTRNRVRRFGQACVLAAELAGQVSHLHAHFLHTPASVARYAARMLRLPFSLSGHAKDVWTAPDWDLAGKLVEADWTVACSAAATERLRAVAPDARIDTIYHGLDLRRFAPDPTPPVPRRGDDPRDPIRVVAVGRAVEKKGFDVLLQALAGLPETLHWRLTHIGAGPLLQHLQRQAQALGVDHRIAWRAAQTQDRVLTALREADLFVLASRVTANGDRDGLPNVLMEAQSQGLPVVATRVSGIPELVRHAATGLLVPPEDAGALGDAIRRLSADPALRQRLGGAAAARIRAQFDSEVWLDRLAARFAAARTTARAA